MKNTTAEYKRLDNQLLSLMTHVHNFLKGRLTLGELGEAEERAEVFRTNQVTNYDEVAERVNTAQIKQENAHLQQTIEALCHDNRELKRMLDKAFDAGFELEYNEQ